MLSLEEHESLVVSDVDRDGANVSENGSDRLRDMRREKLIVRVPTLDSVKAMVRDREAEALLEGEVDRVGVGVPCDKDGESEGLALPLAWGLMVRALIEAVRRVGWSDDEGMRDEEMVLVVESESLVIVSFRVVVLDSDEVRIGLEAEGDVDGLKLIVAP